jgi:NADH-quinone oxidoreductase subunit N
MTARDLIYLLPLLVVAGAALLLMVFIAARRNHRSAAQLTATGFASALAVDLLLLPRVGFVARQITPLVYVDAVSLVFWALILFAGLAVTLLAYHYLERQTERREEFYVLLLLGVTGAMTLAAAWHFASFFLGLELLSVSLFAMAAYLRERPDALEAGVKYLVLAGASSAFLLFGLALIYAACGELGFEVPSVARPAWHLAGVALVLAAIGFKLAVAPFHWWTPDVYQGAPAPVTAFIATASKAAVVAALYRLAMSVKLDSQLMVYFLTAMAVLSMFLGNLLALRQDSVKRILAYSSIAHFGYVLVAFLVGGPAGPQAVLFYLIAYVITTLAAFGVVTTLSTGEADADSLALYRGLFWRRPFLAAVFTASLLSLAGIPLTAGFVGKIYIVAAGVQGRLWGVLLCLVAASVIGLFYYLRIIWTMLSSPEPNEAPALPALPLLAGVMLAALVLAMVWLGVYPNPILRLIALAAAF